jgi:c-di-GMP-binding flagellar brake protein YcgR
LEEELLITCRGRSPLNETICFTRNISGGGLVLETPEAIPPESRLDIELYAPTDCEKQTRSYMRIGAQVRWIRQIPEGVAHEGSNHYRAGIAFDEIDPKDQACLDEYVKKRLMMASARHVT